MTWWPRAVFSPNLSSRRFGLSEEQANLSANGAENGVKVHRARFRPMNQAFPPGVPGCCSSCCGNRQESIGRSHGG